MNYKLIPGLAMAFFISAAVAQTTPPATSPNAPAGQRGGGRRPRVAPFIEDNVPATKYDYHELWKPFYYTKNGNEFRAADGQPGPKYWQNRADYVLAATLNDQTNEITGSELLTYTNNSPQKLDFLWMNLEQNLFKQDSRGSAIVPLRGDPPTLQSRNWGRGQVLDA